MSILRTYNVQNPDSASVNVELSAAGGIKVVGVSTIGNTVVGGGTTQLIVTGDARITGILTIGTSSVTLDGTNNQVNVGTGVTIHHTNGVQVGGNTVHSTGLIINQINVGTGASISSPATNVLTLGTNSTEAIRIGPNGNVGIGTTYNNTTIKLRIFQSQSLSSAPAFLVDVGGPNGGYLEWQTDGTAIGDIGSAYQLFGSPRGDGNHFAINARSDRPLILGSNNTERLRIDSSGRVGINTSVLSSYARTLLIRGTLGLTGEGNADTDIGMGFHRSAGDTEGYIGIGDWAVNGGQEGDFGIASQSNILLGTQNGTERLRITGIGSVGIGITNPEYPFELYATNSILQISSPGVASDNYAQLVFKTGTSSQRCWIWKNPASNTNYGGSESFNFWQGNNAPIAFFTNGTNERVRISGIGTITLRASGGASIEGYNADDNLLSIAKLSRMGYATNYRNLIIGKHLPNSASFTYQSISLNYDPSTNASGSFNGSGNEIFVPNNNSGTAYYTSILQPNTSNNGFNPLVRFGPSGQVLLPNQPAFRAYLSTEWTTNEAFVNSGWTENFDRNNNFSQGTFTAPVAGIYSFGVTWDALNTASCVDIRVNGSTYAARHEPASTDGWETNQLNTILELAANDYVQIYLRNASGGNPIHMGAGHWGWFCGYLIA